ncbi:MAG: PrsW family glutamic-type intramembrane protease [Treponema sp.]|nr:PrsW family glutamic-type intramembrane protease [Treponema sp.]
MAVFWILCAVAFLPFVPVYFWFRHMKYGIARLLLPAAAGFLSVLLAGLVQGFIPLHLPGQSQMTEMLFGVFIRVSLTEELVRFLVLFLMFSIFPFSRILFNGQQSRKNSGDKPELFFGAPSGLAAGLGFAAGESIFYGLASPSVAVLRIFTAVPLHAACGARIGSALGQIRRHHVAAIVLFITAFFIHAVYDLCIQNPVVPEFLPIVIALAAMITSVFNIYYGDRLSVNNRGQM